MSRASLEAGITPGKWPGDCHTAGHTKWADAHMELVSLGIKNTHSHYPRVHISLQTRQKQQDLT